MAEDELGVVPVAGLARASNGAEELDLAQFGCLAHHLQNALVLRGQLLGVGSTHPGTADTGREVTTLHLLGLRNTTIWGT